MKKNKSKGEKQMKNKLKLTAAITLALVGALAAVAQQQTLTGVLTDSMWHDAHGQGQESRRVHADVRQGRYEIRAGGG
jgi:hypothetical protein